MQPTKPNGTGKQHIEITGLHAMRRQHSLDIIARDVLRATQHHDLALQVGEVFYRCFSEQVSNPPCFGKTPDPCAAAMSLAAMSLAGSQQARCQLLCIAVASTSSDG